MNNTNSRTGQNLGMFANIAFILAITLILCGSLFAQFVMGELPCSLCMLQKYGLLLSAVGPVYIIVNHQKGTLTPGNYMAGFGITIVSAFFGAIYSARQMLLHIAPDDKGFGAAFFGIHFYTWSFIAFAIIILYAGVMLSCKDYFMPSNDQYGAGFENLAKFAMIFYFIIVVVVCIAVTFELGLNFTLPGTPVRYNLFHQFFQYQ